MKQARASSGTSRVAADQTGDSDTDRPGEGVDRTLQRLIYNDLHQINRQPTASDVLFTRSRAEARHALVPRRPLQQWVDCL